MKVTTVDHPLVRVQLTELRSERTDRARFRQLLGHITRALVHEAATDLPVEAFDVTSPMGPAPGYRLAQTPVIVPILRAGLGMLDAALDVIPQAKTGFLGLRRDETTLLPEVYMNTIPPDLFGGPALALDPMLATGGSAIYAAEQIRAAGADQITLVCALAVPEGIDALGASGAVDHVVTAVIDSHLNEVGFIVPGLGDAGDRQFGVD